MGKFQENIKCYTTLDDEMKKQLAWEWQARAKAGPGSDPVTAASHHFNKHARYIYIENTPRSIRDAKSSHLTEPLFSWSLRIAWGRINHAITKKTCNSNYLNSA